MVYQWEFLSCSSKYYFSCFFFCLKIPQCFEKPVTVKSSPPFAGGKVKVLNPLPENCFFQKKKKVFLVGKKKESPPVHWSQGQGFELNEIFGRRMGRKVAFTVAIYYFETVRDVQRYLRNRKLFGQARQAMFPL